ncbi:MAG: DUF262 domain-containing protein [Prevotella sp.]|nr:DUF262 domain-containing protein [Prevotella sp.]
MAEYRSATISDIISEMVNRDTFLPAIQREYVWTPYQIEKLFDSLMCGYPISTFLFWKIREENKKNWTSYEFLRDFDREHPHNKYANLDGVNTDIYLVLDGQQRITSFNIALRGSYRYFYRIWRKTYLYLNLLHPKTNDNPEELTYQFKFRENDAVDPKMGEPQLWYRVGDILNYDNPEDAKDAIESRLEKYTEEEKKAAKRMISDLHTCVKISKVVNYYEEKSTDYDKVMEIFIRTNTGGQKLEYSDILLSTATAKWKSLNAREEINSFTDDINKIGSGYSFGKDFVMKGSMYLTEDLPIQYKLSSFTQQNLELIEDHWDETKLAIRRAVELVSRFGFSDKNLVTKLALLPIAQYLRNKDSNKYLDSSDANDVKDQINIQKWLILITLRNLLGASSDSTLNRIRRIIGDKGAVFPYQEIINEFGLRMDFTDEEINNWLSYKYGTRYSYLILSLAYPGRDWKDRRFQEDHIFPYSRIQRKELKKLGFDDEKINRYTELRDTICNLELLSESENNDKRAKPFEQWVSERDDNFKERHLIPQLDSYSMDNFEQFVAARKTLLYQAIKGFSFNE